VRKKRERKKKKEGGGKERDSQLFICLARRGNKKKREEKKEGGGKSGHVEAHSRRPTSSSSSTIRLRGGKSGRKKKKKRMGVYGLDLYINSCLLRSIPRPTRKITHATWGKKKRKGGHAGQEHLDLLPAYFNIRRGTSGNACKNRPTPFRGKKKGRKRDQGRTLSRLLHRARHQVQLHFLSQEKKKRRGKENDDKAGDHRLTKDRQARCSILSSARMARPRPESRLECVRRKRRKEKNQGSITMT